MVLARIYLTEADTRTDYGSSPANFGGCYNFTPDFSLLFSAGHSLAGDEQRIAYLGLYWTWGRA